MPTDTTYSIGDLGRLTGLNVRTIRYYLQQGLLPPSGESGPGAHYGQGHLERLKLIQRLRAQHQPLAEIRAQLSALSDNEVAAAAAEPAEAPLPQSSALEYVRSLLGTGAPRLAEGRQFAALASPNAPPSPSAGAAPASASPLSSTPRREPENDLGRSQWERVTFGPNVELHIRRPLSRVEQKRVERFITIARQVLKEGQP